MKIVIDIPEETYEYVQSRFMYQDKDEPYLSVLEKAGIAIKNGTPIPEGYGKIVDLGKIDKDRIEQGNPVMSIDIYGTTIEAIPLDYLYNLPDLIKKDKKNDD